jgi:DNA-binding NtrC family response regulator
MKHILIVDDDVAVTNYFKVFIAQTGLFETTVVNDSRQVMTLFEKEEFDLVLLDLDMPNVSGMDILHNMNKQAVNIPVVVLTGVNDVDLAVRSMKLGAFDYLVKPVEDDKLLGTIDEALKHSVLHKSIDELPETLTHTQLVNKDAFEHLPTQDPEMIRLFHQAEKLAGSDLSIFIWGESGTGKESLAKAIHNASSRRDKPFIAIEANSFEPDQFPASFFGQVRGWSETREEKPGFLDEANEGTLFLNHIEHLSRPMQTRLQRVIQTNEYYRENSATIRKVDVRMIVSSTKDLTSPKYEKTFSRDLLYHLMINSIRIPPLRERIDDIPLLAEHFLREEVKKSRKKLRGFCDKCLMMLKQYNYPNNVQELLTIVASVVAREESDIITIESLPDYISRGFQNSPKRAEENV